ncbi:DUF7824 domain-containing protein [Kitasatospora sp. NPDC001683]
MPPYLLVTPTDATGAIEPGALVERLAGYQAAGAIPGQADLCTALLRVRPGADPEVLPGAAGRPRGLNGASGQGRLGSGDGEQMTANR